MKKTCDSLGSEDKVRQIYCPMGIYDDPDNARRLAQLKPGGLFRLMGPDLPAAWQATRMAIESSEVPMPIAGDLEGGAYCLPFNTAALNQIGVAACDPSSGGRRSECAAKPAAKASAIISGPITGLPPRRVMLSLSPLRASCPVVR